MTPLQRALIALKNKFSDLVKSGLLNPEQIRILTTIQQNTRLFEDGKLPENPVAALASPEWSKIFIEINRTGSDFIFDMLGDANVSTMLKTAFNYVNSNAPTAAVASSSSHPASGDFWANAAEKMERLSRAERQRTDDGRDAKTAMEDPVVSSSRAPVSDTAGDFQIEAAARIAELSRAHQEREVQLAKEKEDSKRAMEFSLSSFSGSRSEAGELKVRREVETGDSGITYPPNRRATEEANNIIQKEYQKAAVWGLRLAELNALVEKLWKNFHPGDAYSPTESTTEEGGKYQESLKRIREGYTNRRETAPALPEHGKPVPKERVIFPSQGHEYDFRAQGEALVFIHNNKYFTDDDLSRVMGDPEHTKEVLIDSINAGAKLIRLEIFNPNSLALSSGSSGGNYPPLSEPYDNPYCGNTFDRKYQQWKLETSAIYRTKRHDIKFSDYPLLHEEYKTWKLSQSLRP